MDNEQHIYTHYSHFASALVRILTVSEYNNNLTNNHGYKLHLISLSPVKTLPLPPHYSSLKYKRDKIIHERHVAEIV
jgi:hypothetical protein